MNNPQYQQCIDACLRCAAACNYCASACLQEPEIEPMRNCIRLDMECAAFCYATAEILSLGSPRAKELCRLCAAICAACGEECGKHQMNHCQQCAIACNACAEACAAM
jgi:hypothetical protein